MSGGRRRTDARTTRRTRQEPRAIRSAEGEGYVEGAVCADRQFARRVETWREGLWIWQETINDLAGWHHGSEEGRRPQGREGRRQTVLITPPCARDVAGADRRQGSVGADVTGPPITRHSP